MHDRRVLVIGGVILLAILAVIATRPPATPPVQPTGEATTTPAGSPTATATTPTSAASPTPSPTPMAREERVELRDAIQASGLGTLAGEWAFIIRRSFDHEVRNGQVVVTNRARDSLTLVPLDAQPFDGRARDVLQFRSAIGSTFPTNHVGPQLSPDGRTIVMSIGVPRSTGGERLGLVVVDLSSGSVRQLTTDPDRHDDTPAWSPDGSLIAFARRQAGTTISDDGVWTVRPDGSGLRQIVGPAQGVGRRTFVFDWSADGRHIAFTQGEGSYLLLDTSTGRRSSLGEVFFAILRDNADWRRDGPQFVGAFSEGSTGGAQRIAVAGGPGAPALDVATAPADRLVYLTSPRWRPSAEEILFVREPAGVGGGAPTASTIEIVSAGGGATREIHSSAERIRVAWTPDGDEVAFVQSQGVAVYVTLIRPDGSGARQIYGTGGAPEGRVLTVDFGTLRF